ncbi:hypothetical protein WG904_03390 [Pedobacter sp. Du54]|uniref:hypothetical protein n=1 Tax=Pedobacter anseongensis TaxID=3133439 RepID=UPI0030A520C8
MELNVAFNTLIAVMMAIFPGFLFRKFYYRGEFTKQFYQSNQIDKLLWNIFFSFVTIAFTISSLYLFKTAFGTNVLESISYENIKNITDALAKNNMPARDVMKQSYEDIILIVASIYFFSCFFGYMLHWLVRVLKLDARFQLVRFKNYWYYFFHGGKILFKNTSDKKFAFAQADVLCEFSGKIKIFSGIVSQYTINRDDNALENIFLTETNVLDYEDQDEEKKISIPGTLFCIPNKNIININLRYYYEDETVKTLRGVIAFVVNIIFFISLLAILISLFFDLSDFGIITAKAKFFYAFWAFFGLLQFRILCGFIRKPMTMFRVVGTALFILSAYLWIRYVADNLNFWIPLITTVIAVIVIAIDTPHKDDTGE